MERIVHNHELQVNVTSNNCQNSYHKLYWNFIISIQYTNIELNKERSSAHEYGCNTELPASRASSRQMYIGTTDSWTEYLALWISL